MIVTTRVVYQGIPLLYCYEQERNCDYKGIILFFHGFKGAKENNQRETNDLAQAGYFAVGVDAIGHGERRYPDFEERFQNAGNAFEVEFIRIVTNTAQEIPSILDHLITVIPVKTENFGIAGISMGGFITNAAIVVEPRLKAAVSILGSPKWNIEELSPEKNIGKFSKIHLLSVNAGKDEVVPAIYTRNFHIQLGRYFPDYDDRFSYVEYSNSGHFMNDKDWKLCWSRTKIWFEKHLSDV